MQTYPQTPNYAPQNAAPNAFPGAAAGAATGYGNYEFNENENVVLKALGGRVKIWGVIAIVVGALYTLAGMFFFLKPALLTYLVTGIINIVVGATFFGAGNALNRVTSTQGNDLSHLMMGAQKLSRAFTIQIVTAIIGFVLVIAAFCIGVLIAISQHASP